jgi:methanogenic corrinoid protein MtbC1
MSPSEQPCITEQCLAEAVADLRENEALAIVQFRLERGDDPVEIIEDCQAGMRDVGERYAQQRYFLSALIMAGDILREIMEIVLPVVEHRFAQKSAGRVLLGTVRGDIHDLGKNMLLMLLRSYGFTTLDLGVDVQPARFVEAARDFKPHVIGVSVLINSAYPNVRETVSALREMMSAEGHSIPIMLGGQVDEHVCRYSSADYWTTDAMEGVRLCQRLVGAA